MNYKKWASYLAILLVVSIIITIFGIMFNFNRLDDLELTRYNRNVDLEDRTYTFNADEFDHLDIDFDISSLEIKSHSGDEVIVETPHNDIYVDINGSTLAIEENFARKFGILSFNLDPFFNSGHKTVILLPTSFVGNIDINCNIADIHITDITADSLSIDGDLGSVELNNILATDIDVSTNLGDIELTDVTAKTIELDNDLGSIDIDDIFAEDITINNNLGNVSGTINGDINDFEIDSDTALGSNNLRNQRDGQYSLHVDTDLGSVDIDFRNN